jgi:hypothetical protein
MLAAITINDPDERFTAGDHNILRLVAYPLAANFGSKSKKVTRALREDNHALALIPRTTLESILASDDQAPSILTSLGT